MSRILNSALWIIFLVLTPLTFTGVLSQNAIPGDILYPVKKSFENVALTAFAFFPETKANYTIQIAENRYDEAQKLILAKSDSQGLDTLIAQVQSATQTVDVLKNQEQKQVLQEKLIASIDSYQQKLIQVQEQVAVAPTPTPTQTLAQNNTQNSQQQQTQIPNSPSPITTAFPKPTSPNPTTTSIPTSSSPKAVVSQQPAPDQTAQIQQAAPINPQQKQEIQQSINETQEKLKEIKKELEKRKEETEKKNDEKRVEIENKKNERERNSKDSKNDR